MEAGHTPGTDSPTESLTTPGLEREAGGEWLGDHMVSALRKGQVCVARFITRSSSSVCGLTGALCRLCLAAAGCFCVCGARVHKVLSAALIHRYRCSVLIRLHQIGGRIWSRWKGRGGGGLTKTLFYHQWVGRTVDGPDRGQSWVNEHKQLIHGPSR